MILPAKHGKIFDTKLPTNMNQYRTLSNILSYKRLIKTAAIDINEYFNPNLIN